jgi:hypothetical protein
MWEVPCKCQTEPTDGVSKWWTNKQGYKSARRHFPVRSRSPLTRLSHTGNSQPSSTGCGRERASEFSVKWKTKREKHNLRWVLLFCFFFEAHCEKWRIYAAPYCERTITTVKGVPGPQPFSWVGTKVAPEHNLLTYFRMLTIGGGTPFVTAQKRKSLRIN